MENVMVIQKGASLKVLSLVGKRIEKALREELKGYSSTVCWQLLDDELTMQVLVRVENSGGLFGRACFSSDALEEKGGEYRLCFTSSLPEESFRYNKERLLEWSVIENNVVDYLLRIKLSPYLVKRFHLHKQ